MIPDYGTDDAWGEYIAVKAEGAYKGCGCDGTGLTRYLTAINDAKHPFGSHRSNPAGAKELTMRYSMVRPCDCHRGDEWRIKFECWETCRQSDRVHGKCEHSQK